MATVLYSLALLSVAAVPATAYLILFKPGVLMRWFMSFMLYKCGLRVKYAQTGKYRLCYAERGKQQEGKSTLVLLHGFSASKDMFVSIVQKLPHDVHVIVLDLPGHGFSDIPAEGDDIAIEAIAKYCHELIDVIGVNKQKFHLVGTSMGGAIAILYASLYPQELERLTLICPAMVTPVETEFLKEFRAGECRLLPRSPEAILDMLNSCLYKPVKIPKLVLNAVYALREPKNEYYARLLESLRAAMIDHDAYAENAFKITMPTQLMWGKHDEIIHPSGADLLQKELPNCQRVDILERCGHSINMDRPGLTTKCLLDFRKHDTDKKLD